MQKELNPELFNERQKTVQSFESMASQAKDLPLFDYDRQISELRQQIQGIKEDLGPLKNQILELQKTCFLKMEKLQQAVAKLEVNHNGLAQETASKVSSLNSKILDQSLILQKAQEMSDRHNQMVKNFEVRMTHLQTILKQKETLLLQTQSALTLAKQEIARMIGR